jgi:hypothetical protein
MPKSRWKLAGTDGGGHELRPWRRVVLRHSVARSRRGEGGDVTYRDFVWFTAGACVTLVLHLLGKWSENNRWRP